MPAPSRFVESLVGFVIPPSCREEILGDLHERYESAAQYLFAALCVVPFVILSRIRRTADLQLVLLEGISTYSGFLGAALITRTAMDPGLLAVPAVIAVLATRVADAYTKSYGPAIGLSLALLSTYRLMPRTLLFIGVALSFLVCSGVRVLFSSQPGKMQGIHVPASWLKSEPGEVLNWKHVAVFAVCFAVVFVLKFWIRR